MMNKKERIAMAMLDLNRMTDEHLRLKKLFPNKKFKWLWGYNIDKEGFPDSSDRQWMKLKLKTVFPDIKVRVSSNESPYQGHIAFIIETNNKKIFRAIGKVLKQHNWIDSVEEFLQEVKKI